MVAAAFTASAARSSLGRANETCRSFHSPIVGEDSTFNEAVVDFEEKFDIASFPVFDKTFDVALGSQDLGLIMV
jgi:hypothetical protein